MRIADLLVRTKTTNAEMRERTCWYVTETRWRITPQTGFSATFADDG